jgi:hypothetical protein
MAALGRAAQVRGEAALAAVLSWARPTRRRRPYSRAGSSDADQDVRLAARRYHGAAGSLSAVQLRDRPMAITSAGAMWSR